MTDMHQIRLRVNGREHELHGEARRTLADMLRHDLGYTGTTWAASTASAARARCWSTARRCGPA